MFNIKFNPDNLDSYKKHLIDILESKNPPRNKMVALNNLIHVLAKFAQRNSKNDLVASCAYMLMADIYVVQTEMFLKGNCIRQASETYMNAVACCNLSESTYSSTSSSSHTMHAMNTHGYTSPSNARECIIAKYSELLTASLASIGAICPV